MVQRMIQWLHKLKWFHMSPSILLKVSGAVWLLIGYNLLDLGIPYMFHGHEGIFFSQNNYSSLFKSVASSFDAETTAIILIVFAIGLGYIKSRFVLRKSADRTIDRLSNLSNPTSLFNIYTKQNYIMIGCMMFLGMSMDSLHLPWDVRSIIDVAVGSGLLLTSIAYFRAKPCETPTCGNASPS